MEGNLLAAAQEIEKLKLLAEGNQIDAATVQAAVADSARFDVFGLIDAALAGEAAHALRILEGLRGEGIEPPGILWGLAREIRLLAGLSQQYGQGIPLEKAFAQARPPVWDKRRPLLTRALQRHSSSRWNQMLRRVRGQNRLLTKRRNRLRSPHHPHQCAGTRYRPAPPRRLARECARTYAPWWRRRPH